MTFGTLRTYLASHKLSASERLVITSMNPTHGARARRGAGNEPKRKRSREDGHQPSETHAAKPLRSGRQPQAKALVAKDPSQQPGTLKLIGGSMSDDWNNRLVNDTIGTLWIFEADRDRERKLDAAVAALIGIGPKCELEGMMAAQLLASHYAAMEC